MLQQLADVLMDEPRHGQTTIDKTNAIKQVKATYSKLLK